VVLPTLVVTGGPRDGQELVLEAPSAEKLLGSGPSCHLRVEATNVDVVHAQVAWADEGLLLSDVGSQAGTYVNGERIGDAHPLHDGDRVTLGPPGSSGSVKLLVFIPAALPADAPMSLAPPDAKEDAVLDFGETAAPPADPDAFVLAEDDAGPAATAAAPPRAAPPPRPAPAPAPKTPAVILDEPASGRTPPPVGAAAGPGVVPPPRTVKPEYTNDIPSIGSEGRVREPLALPPPPAVPAAKAARGKGASFQMPPIPRAVGLAVGAAVLVGGAFAAYAFFTKPPPVITSVNPPKVEAGESVTIVGTSFSADASGNTVRFGEAAGQVKAASETQLTVAVPDGLTPSGAVDVQVTVETRGSRSNALFVNIARVPRPTALEPDVALPGAELTIKGQNLDLKPFTILVGGAPADVRRATPTALQIVVPAIPVSEGQSTPVVFKFGIESIKPLSLVLGRLPMVLSATPPNGPVGQRVTLQGRGFDPAPAGNVVTMGGVRALVFSATPTELQVAVPAPATVASQVPMPVVVQARGGTSSAQTQFTALYPSGMFFRPRFLPALLPDLGPERHVYVSTQLGPVMVLTGPAGAPSVAERAAATAAKLNDLMEAAAGGRPVSLEVRDTPAPAVAVAGGDVLVTATPDDGEGYVRESGGKGAKPSPKQLAQHWAALLSDYLGLFGQRQRPIHVIEMAAATGKVLTEIYTEADRRGPGAGVPTSVVNPISPAWAKGLRDLAFVLPGAGGNPGAAVAGRWVGSMDEPGGQRAIDVQLRVEGKGLAGTITTKAGQLAMGVPLNDVVYEKGQLRFRLTSGGVTRSFQGVLEGATLSGTIHQGTSTAAPIGRFTLRFVE
jgi:hypothetical protein